jgi:protein TonB
MLDKHYLILEEAQAAATRPHVVLPSPKVEPLHDVFAEAMLEDNSTHRSRSPFDWVASMAVHVAILAVLLILPLYFTAGLDVHRFNLTFLAPPVTPPAAPPPPPLTASAVQRAVRSVSTRAFVAGKLTAPTFIPNKVVMTPGEASLPEETMIAGGVPGGMPGGELGGVLGGVLGGALKSVPAPAAPVVSMGPKKPVMVGGDVKPPRLLFGPEPKYPALARQAHLMGLVVIEAVIDESGNVTGMRAISGHPILIPAAMEAVSKRKYEPTILDGEPTPIDLRVEVSFSMVS